MLHFVKIVFFLNFEYQELLEPRLFLSVFSIIEMHSKKVTNADKDLGTLSTRIDHLQAKFQQLTEEAAFMKIELKSLTERLQVAEFLVERLESEYVRWSRQVSHKNKRCLHLAVAAPQTQRF